MPGARAALESLQGVEGLELSRPKKKHQIGVARFKMRREVAATREDIIAVLLTKKVHTYSIERVDLGLLRGLLRWAKHPESSGDDLKLLDHGAAESVLRAFAVLRGWREDVRSANSPFAVTPAVESLLLAVDAHAELLRARKLKLDPDQRVRTECIGKRLVALPNERASARRRWSESGKKLAAAARLLEIPAFEHYVRELRVIEREAMAQALKITGDAPNRKRARVQHRALATHAAQMARLIDKSLAGMRL